MWEGIWRNSSRYDIRELQVIKVNTCYQREATSHVDIMMSCKVRPRAGVEAVQSERGPLLHLATLSNKSGLQNQGDDIRGCTRA